MTSKKGFFMFKMGNFGRPISYNVFCTWGYIIIIYVLLISNYVLSVCFDCDFILLLCFYFVLNKLSTTVNKASVLDTIYSPTGYTIQKIENEILTRYFSLISQYVSTIERLAAREGWGCHMQHFVLRVNWKPALLTQHSCTSISNYYLKTQFLSCITFVEGVRYGLEA